MIALEKTDYTEIKDAIFKRAERFSADDDVSLGLFRVANNEYALDIVRRFGLNEYELEFLVQDFGNTVWIRKNFPFLMRDCAELLAERRGDLEAISRTIKIVRDFKFKKNEGVRSAVTVRDGYWECLLADLQDLRGIFDSTIRIAEETPVRIGATRKRNGETAAENAAMGWLVASIEHHTGRPWLRETCILAEILLDIGEVSEERLRGAQLNMKRQ